MPSITLEKPLHAFQSEALWLAERFAEGALTPLRQDSRLAAEMTVIRLHDAWARFCRELIVLSAYGGINTLSGLLLTKSHPAIGVRGDVVPVLIGTFRKKLTEPLWYAATECIDAGQRLHVQNLSTIAAALSASNSPATLLRDVRNFYAHRKASTAFKAFNAVNFVLPHRPNVFDLNSYTSGGSTIFRDWTLRLSAIAQAAVQ